MELSSPTLNSTCEALFLICSASKALGIISKILFFMFSGNSAGSICPVSIQVGNPVVNFLVIANIVCFPLKEILSQLYSFFPSITSSTIAHFSNEESHAFNIDFFNSSFV